MPVNAMQYKWGVGNFNIHFNFHELKSKSNYILGIYPLLKKIVLVLMLYILSHVVPGLLTFSDDLLTGESHIKPFTFQSTSSSYLISLRGFMHFFWFYKDNS